MNINKELEALIYAVKNLSGNMPESHEYWKGYNAACRDIGVMIEDLSDQFKSEVKINV